jgi:hypothetical protein
VTDDPCHYVFSVIQPGGAVSCASLYLIEVLVAKIKSVSSLGTPDQPTAWAAVALGGDGRCYGTLINSKAGAYGQFVYAEFPVGTQCLGRVATPDTVTSPNYPGN